MKKKRLKKTLRRLTIADLRFVSRAVSLAKKRARRCIHVSRRDVWDSLQIYR